MTSFTKTIVDAVFQSLVQGFDKQGTHHQSSTNHRIKSPLAACLYDLNFPPHKFDSGDLVFGAVVKSLSLEIMRYVVIDRMKMQDEPSGQKTDV